MKSNSYDFVCDYYDAFVNADYDVEFFKNESLKESGKVIELGCGTGRLSIPLVQAGVDLTCVDISKGMLDRLQYKANNHQLVVKMLWQDVCDLKTDDRFDLAIFPFQSLMEIVGESSRRSALSSIYNCLKPGGRFICTLHNPALRAQFVDGVQRTIGSYPFGKGAVVVSGSEHGGHPTVTRYQYFEFYVGNELVWKKLQKLEFDLIAPDSFHDVSRSVGFEITDVVGDYQGSDFLEESSPHQIWFLRRPV